jgi:hypothetical protein
MIKNEKQYRIKKAQARRFEGAHAVLAQQVRPSSITPRLWQAQRDAADSQLQELQEQVDAYKRLHLGKSKELVLEAVEDLPKTLIRARIASGMTQEGLAQRLGVRTQDPALRGDGIRERQFRPRPQSRSGSRPEDAKTCKVGPQWIT